MNNMMKDIHCYCVSPRSALREAMIAIDNTGEGIALVMDRARHLVGVLTDGDIRRALINDADLDSQVENYMQKEYIWVGEEVNRNDVVDLMQARIRRQIPVLDSEGRLVGLHLFRKIVGHEYKPNWAIIMAGGEGTRLRPITENIPKPMVKVAGRPIIERIILHLVSYGVRKIYIAVNYLGHIIEDYLGDGERLGCLIDYLREDKPLGTGGSLSLLPERPQYPILVMNGDLVMQTDFDAMLRFHDAGSYYATMGLQPYTHEVAFGCAQVENNQIKSIEEKPILQKMVNAGIYVLSPKAVQDVPPNQFFPITTLFENALNLERDCGAYVMEEEWSDIGNPHQLRKANGLT